MDVTAKLEALAAGPKPFGVRMTFSDGTTDSIMQPRRSQAESLFNRYSGKIGRQFRLFPNGYDKAPTFPALVRVELIEEESK